MNVDVRCLCIFVLSILPIFSPAQEWVARYDGPANSEDRALALAVDDAGNVYVTGASGDTVTGSDYATVKYDSTGIQQWVARYDGPASGADLAKAMSIDGAGNVYVTGSSHGGVLTHEDYATVKYDSLGGEQWVVRYSSLFDNPDCANAIAVDDAGSVYVTGSVYDFTNFNYATIKYNSSGVEQWVMKYGTLLSQDEASVIVLDADANVIVTGASSSQLSSYDYATVKYDSGGIQQWVARYDGPASGADLAKAMSIDGAGNVYVTGYSAGQGTGFDYATIKYSAAGIEQWIARYNGSANSDDRAYAIAVDDDRNVYVTGKSNDSIRGPDYATVKYDSSGIEQWVARYNGPADGEDYACAVAISNGGNICVTGYSYGVSTAEDYATIMYDSSGIEQWVVRYNGPGNGCDEACAIAIRSEAVYVTGSSMGQGTHMDYATIRYACTGVIEYEPISAEVDQVVSTIFYGHLQLPEGKECKVFDIMGRVVEPEKIHPGIYFVEVDGVMVQKVIKIR
jgi:hypothetical protein